MPKHKVGTKISQEELDLLYIPERVSALEVAEKMRVPQKSNVFSDIRLKLTPYLIDPISLIGKTRVPWIYLIAPTQSGKTVFLQTAVADSIDQDPGTLIYILPDEKSGKKALKEKVIGMIDETPDLAKHKVGNRALSTEKIELDNMTIYPGWSGSLASLSSTPAKRVILDEIRLMKLAIGEESNAIKLAGDRLTTYMEMGLAQGFGVSTPSVEGDLLYQQTKTPGTTVLHWAIRCETCGNIAVLDFFKNIKFDKKTKKVTCSCTECGHIWDDKKDMKQSMNACGEYVKVDKNGNIEQVNIEELEGQVVFWYDSLVSPFRSFERIWNEFIKTRGNVNDYKNFWQCWLAKFWIDDVSKTSVSLLEKHIVESERGDVPEWCKFISAGVDTQDKGFYVTTRAWGGGRKTRIIDQFFIDCNMNVSTEEELKRIFKRDIENRVYSKFIEKDKPPESWQIGAWAIDTGGHRTKEVYAACAYMERCIQVKGKNNQDVTIKKSTDKKLDLWLVRTEEYLNETESRAEMEEFEIFRGIEKDFLRQWVNIRKSKKTNKQTGEETVIWKYIGQFDYRMADVHTFICLDIPTPMGTIRSRLEEEDFSYNPIVRRVEVEADSSDPLQDNYNEFEGEELSDWNVGSLEGW